MMEKSQKCLPDDLIIQIFLKLRAEDLNVKNLLKLRCVCKSWYRIIGTNSLINSALISNINYHSYLLCTHRDRYTLQELKEEDEEKDLILRDISSDHRGKYYYTPELFGINKRGFDIEVMVHGICKGLLCVSDLRLYTGSSIYLWNPVIRKAKKISMMVQDDVYDEPGDADLCFGYFDDDYKVVKIVPVGEKYRVGVYSLRSDDWKVMYCDGSNSTFWWLSERSTNRFVNGVAYFLKKMGRILCFDLCEERIRELKFPNNMAQSAPFSVEPWGESIAVIEIKERKLTMWVLRNCGATNTSTWEKKVAVRFKTPFHRCPLGFTKNGKYLVRDDDLGSNRLYLWDFGTSQVEECKTEPEIEGLWAIDSLVGNLVLIDEKTLDPFVETEPCSTQTTCVLYKSLPAARKNATEMLDPAQNRTQRRRRTDRKKGKKESLDKAQNHRNEVTEMKKQRKK